MDRIRQGVVGFRSWTLRPSDDELGIPRVWLGALSGRVTEGRGTWWPGTNESYCSLLDPAQSNAHPTPDYDCNCGFHAWYDVETLNRTAIGRMLTRQGHAAQGMCLGTGRVALQRRQWRAQRARVVALFLPDAAMTSARGARSAAEYNLLLEAASEWYDVPLIPRSEAMLWAQLVGANGKRLYDESP